MEEKPIHIKFHNRQNPQSTFDIIDLDSVFRMKGLNHSPMNLHLVEFYLLLFIEEGEGQHTIDFTTYDYHKGALLTIRKDQIHKFHRSDTVKGKLLLFTDAFLVSYLEKLEAIKSLQLFNEIIGVPKIQLGEQEFEEVSQLIYRIWTEYFDSNDDYSQGIIRSELHILIAKLYRVKSNQNQVIHNRKYLSEFIAYQNLIEQHASQLTRVKDYADRLGMSTKTLNTVTQSIVHKSAKAFLDEIRTKQIKRLLINTSHSVKEIAFASGFEETTNFYKYFKRQVQKTPEQFRVTFL
ncbi:MAG: helix-turn-helix transcriptional regulator [Bacteroidota bacterium]